MALFRYRATDKEGNSIEATFEEASARRVVHVLQERGLTVNTVEPVDTPSLFRRKETRLTWEDLDQLNDQLLTIVRGGMPLPPALAAMASDVRNPRLKGALDDVRRDTESGVSLADAFARHPDRFSPTYTTLIRAGERAGNLSAILELLASYSKRMLEFKNSMQMVFAYPMMLIVTACAVVYGIMLKVVPVYMDIFKDFGGRLPFPTQFLSNVSDVVRYHWIECGAVLGIFIAVCLSLIRTAPQASSRGYRRDWINLHLPLVGRLYARASLARFCRTLGMMLEARVPMMEGLDLASAAAGNAVLSRAIAGATTQVAAGMPLADALEQTGYFENGFCWLLRNAEQRGEAPRALRAAEESYERNIEHMRKWILTMAGPVTVILVGAIIGWIVVSLYLPLFALGDVVSGH